MDLLDDRVGRPDAHRPLDLLVGDVLRGVGQGLRVGRAPVAELRPDRIDEVLGAATRLGDVWLLADVGRHPRPGGVVGRVRVVVR